jgi:hypothetical protein
MPRATFDVFLGTPDNVVRWLGCFEGLACAREQMDQMAADTPGQYFLYCVATQTTIAAIQTFAKPQSTSSGA